MSAHLHSFNGLWHHSQCTMLTKIDCCLQQTHLANFVLEFCLSLANRSCHNDWQPKNRSCFCGVMVWCRNLQKNSGTHSLLSIEACAHHSYFLKENHLSFPDYLGIDMFRPHEHMAITSEVFSSLNVRDESQEQFSPKL